MIAPLQELCIIPLEKGHNLSSFSSSNEDLNDFLHNDASRSQDDLISRTYLCIWHSRLAGFFTLVTDTIEVKPVELEDGIDDYNSLLASCASGNLAPAPQPAGPPGHAPPDPHARGNAGTPGARPKGLLMQT
jgi:hypothetical protein